MPSCSQCGREYGKMFDACPYCPSAAAAPGADPSCPSCRGPLWLHTEKPNSGTGCIIAILGLVLAPVLIGIPVIIYGISTMNDTKRMWHCRQCGAQFPAQMMAKPVKPIGWTPVVVLVLILVGVMVAAYLMNR